LGKKFIRERRVPMALAAIIFLAGVLLFVIGREDIPAQRQEEREEKEE